jgi:hypothetical protein
MLGQTTQEFWCPEEGLGNPVVKILIPTVCQHCGTVLILHSVGSSQSWGSFKGLGSCEHYATYPDVWANRVVGHGAHCTSKRSTKCLEFYPDAENKSNFVCFACRSGW